MLRVARAVWNGTLKAVNSLASVQQRRMGFVWLFFKHGSILASESLLHCIKESLLQRCDGKQFEKLCDISGVVLIALLTKLKKTPQLEKLLKQDQSILGLFLIFFLMFQVFIHYQVMNVNKKPGNMSSFCSL